MLGLWLSCCSIGTAPERAGSECTGPYPEVPSGLVSLVAMKAALATSDLLKLIFAKRGC